ncbi:hypothetical protein GCM10009076_15200 [Erythrobacter ramosus]
MNKISHHRIWMALVSVATLAAASTGGVAIAQGSPASPPRQCLVTVDRSAEASAFEVVRQEFGNGRCICAVTTGPRDQAASVEDQIAALRQSKICSDATSVAMAGKAPGFPALGLGAGLVGAAAIVVAVANGQSRPVSP